jgi:hypothetical protein|tara:strand:+ start:134 stop:511 length:378 start_codon:yes stop_codon:yes gene_type:complete
LRIEHYVDEQLEDISAQIRAVIESFGFDYDKEDDRVKFLKMSISLFHYVFSTREELIKEILDEIEREFQVEGTLDISDYLKHKEFKLHAERFIATKIAHTIKDVEQKLKDYTNLGVSLNDTKSNL